MRPKSPGNPNNPNNPNNKQHQWKKKLINNRNNNRNNLQTTTKQPTTKLMTANMAATEYKRKLRCRSTNNDIDDTVGTAGDTSTPGISSNSTPYRTPGLLGEILTRRRSAPASTKPLNREDDSGTSTIRAPPRTPVGDAPPHEDSTASFDNLKINLFGVDDASDSQMMRVETPQSKTVAVANTSNLTTITPTAVDTCTQDVVKDAHTTISLAPPQTPVGDSPRTRIVLHLSTT